MEINGKDDELISNANESGCLCATETLLSSLRSPSCQAGAEAALPDRRGQLCRTGHGARPALRAVIDVKSLQAICWPKYVRVKHLSKQFEYSLMWKKKIKACCCITGEMKRILMGSFWDHGMPCYVLKTMDLDWFGTSCTEKQLTVHCVADNLANSNIMSVTVNFLFEITEREKGMGVLGKVSWEIEAWQTPPESFTFLEKLQQDHSYSLMCAGLHCLGVNHISFVSCNELVDKGQNCLSFQTIVHIDAAAEENIMQSIPS